MNVHAWFKVLTLCVVGYMGMLICVGTPVLHGCQKPNAQDVSETDTTFGQLYTGIVLKNSRYGYTHTFYVNKGKHKNDQGRLVEDELKRLYIIDTKLMSTNDLTINGVTLKGIRLTNHPYKDEYIIPELFSQGMDDTRTFIIMALIQKRGTDKDADKEYLTVQCSFSSKDAVKRNDADRSEYKPTSPMKRMLNIAGANKTKAYGSTTQPVTSATIVDIDQNIAYPTFLDAFAWKCTYVLFFPGNTHTFRVFNAVPEDAMVTFIPNDGF